MDKIWELKDSSRLGTLRVIDSTVHAFCPRRPGGYLESMKVVTAKSWRSLEKELVLEGTFKKGGFMDIREEIKERGRLEGRLEGWQKGQQEGWQKGQQEIVSNMLKKSADIAFISEMTGLPIDEIKKLKK